MAINDSCDTGAAIMGMEGVRAGGGVWGYERDDVTYLGLEVRRHQDDALAVL